MMDKKLISVANLYKRFNLEAGFFARQGNYVKAVNDVSFFIGRNESYGLVGESGSGKSTTARLLVKMYEADSGEISFHEQDDSINVRLLKGASLKSYREKVKYIFQDPARSLNPRMSIYEILTSGIKWSTAGAHDKKQLRDEAASLLEEVGLSSMDLDRKPSEFSGGQRQRISIARGLMMKPKLLICDEVVSALDVSVQAQILKLLIDLKESRNKTGMDLSFLFIAHNLKVASYFCDRIAVMYKGEIMEEASAKDLWKEHYHPYTSLLFSSAIGNDSIPKPADNTTPAESASVGSTPLSTADSAGCSFASRCPHAMEKCKIEKPEIKFPKDDHYFCCHL